MILLASKCNYNLKFIIAIGKYSKSLVYYIIDYITKTSIYTSHVIFFTICNIKNQNNK